MFSGVSHITTCSRRHRKGEYLPPASEEWREVIFSLCVSVHTSTGGGSHVQVQVGGGGVPDPAMYEGGSHVSDFPGGGPRSQIFQGGSQVSHFLGGGVSVSDFRGGGGVPGLNKGKNFWHQIWLDTCSDREKNFCWGTPPFPVKGKIFDTRFGLIHVQTGKKNFCRGTPPRE